MTTPTTDYMEARAVLRDRRTYIVAHDEYMGTAQAMFDRVCTWRQLLEELTGIEGDDDDRKALSDRALVEYFNDANGDGQPYYMVWDVQAGEKVLG